MKKVRFHTLGCKVNLYETEGMKALFQQGGYTITEQDDADVFVINTCTVTAVGDKKSRQMIRRVKRTNPDAIVVVVGCYAQVFPDQVRALPDVDIILGTTDRKDIVTAVEGFRGGRVDLVRIKIDGAYEEIASQHQSRTRATIKVQDGCTNFCSYCIIPYARGPVRSRAIASAVTEVADLVADGFSEFVLVGIHLASYGRDLGLTLMDMIKSVCSIPGVHRVRLSSLEPTWLTEQVVAELASLPSLCHSFHVSMQSGCTQTLKRMNRKYTREEYLAVVERLRAAMPHCSISTDVIVGFPQESEWEFAQSMELVKQANFADLHVFPYSKRSGTPAAELEGQIPQAVKAQRSAEMIALGKEMTKAYCQSFVGREVEVLFEKQLADGLCQGLTREMVTVLVKGQQLEGTYRTVSITQAWDDHCEGELI